MSEGGTAYLTCNVYGPRDSNNNSVKWYRSVEYLVEDISENSFLVAKTAYNDILLDSYKLIIRNIDSSDSGVYWCQISVDGFCFIPSAYVNITVNTSFTGNGCSSFTSQPSQVCAVDNSLSCQVTPTPPVVNDSTPTVIALTSSLISMSPVAIPPPPTSPTNSSVLVGSLSFIIVLLAVTLITTIFAFVLAWTRRDRKNQCETCKSKPVG